MHNTSLTTKGSFFSIRKNWSNYITKMTNWGNSITQMLMNTKKTLE